MIRESLEATKSQLIATLQVVDIALAAIDEQERKGCQHEQKQDVSTFNNLGRWYCPACRTYGGGEPVAQEETHHG